MCYWILLVYKKLSLNLTPLKKSKLSKKAQEKEYEIERKLQKTNQDWNDWRFQKYCNKLEWLNPRSRCEQKNPF